MVLEGHFDGWLSSQSGQNEPNNGHFGDLQAQEALLFNKTLNVKLLLFRPANVNIVQVLTVGTVLGP